MQTTSSGWTSKINAPFRKLNYGVQLSINRVAASGVGFFTIGTSTIGGNDILKSGGDYVAFFDRYDYDDYSPFIMSIDVKRSIGQYPFGLFMAQADVEFDNSHLQFLPNSNTTGSGILPNRPIKISMGFGGEYLNQFTGFAGQPENDILSKVTTFHAFDAMNYISGYLSQASGSKVGLYANQIFAALLGEIGFGVNQYALDTSLQKPIGYVATYNTTVGEIFQDLAEAEQGLAFVDENGIFRFWNRQHFNTTSGTAVFNIGYSNAQNIEYENTPIINDVIVKANPRAVQTKQKIWQAATTITLLPNQQTLYVAKFSDDDGDLPVTSVDVPINSSSTLISAFIANDQTNGSGNDLGAQVTVVSAYSYGNQYWVTFANNGPHTIYLTSMVLYGTPAKVTAHIEQRYYDQGSIDSYGRNPANNGVPLEIDNDYIQDSASANTLARTLVYEYKDARKRYMVPVAVASNPALQIGDFGSLTINDTKEVKSVWLVGREEKLDREGVYTQYLELEERSIQHYFTIGTSTIGGVDPIAP